MLPVLFLVVVVDLIGFGIVIPLLPFYGEYFAASPAEIGMLMATFSIGQLISAPILGRFSDQYGRRPILLMGLAGTVLSYGLMAYADSLAILFLARALGGLMAGNIGAAFAYAADITTPENRAKGMGVVGAAFGIGFVLGPAIGGILAGPDPMNADYRTPALVAGGLSATAFVLAVLFLTESLSPEMRAKAAQAPAVSRWSRMRQAFGRPVLGAALVQMFFAIFVFAGMEAVFGLWSERQFFWGPEQNGYLFAGIGVVSALIQGGGIGRLARRYGERRLVVAGALALMVGIGLLPMASTVPILCVVMLVIAAGFSLLNPALNSLVSKSVESHEQGIMLGVGRSVSTLSRVVGPAWAGNVFEGLGRHWPFWMGAVVMLVVVVLAVRQLRQPITDNPSTG